MKKLIIIILSLFLIFITLPKNKVALADETYAMVITENASFYSDASQKYEKFYLPYSYFVKVIEIGAEFSRVLYMDDSKNYPQSEGYVKTSDLNFSVNPNSNPYPKITLSCEISDVLFSNAENLTPLTVINQNTPAIFYGELPINGETYLYVYANGYAGYVRKSSFSQFTVPPHESLKTLIDNNDDKDSSDLTSQAPNDTTTQALNDNQIVKTIVIAIVLILVLVFVVFISFIHFILFVFCLSILFYLKL